MAALDAESHSGVKEKGVEPFGGICSAKFVETQKIEKISTKSERLTPSLKMLVL